MKQLGYTSIEHSKKLIEAGLNPNTADLCFLKREINETYIEVPIIRPVGNMTKILPCWSLGALIGLMPKTIETKKPKNLYFPEILPANNCVAYIALNKNKEYLFLKLFATSFGAATLIDNMVAMICWLLENNYIKKGNVK